MAKNDKNTTRPATTSRQRVGKVTQQEMEEIRALYERKNGLTELFRSLAGMPDAQDSPLYDRLVTDMGRLTMKFSSWWQEKAKTYGWESAPDGSWTIDFETLDIYLVRSANSAPKL